MAQTHPASGAPQPKQDLLEEIRNRAPLPPGVTPERALSAVVCALDQHVTGGESRHLFDALPRDVQPLLAPCLIHRGEPAERFDWDGLVKRVADHLGVSRAWAEVVIPGVMAAVRSRLPEKEVEHVASQLPEDMKRVWVGKKESLRPFGPGDVVDDVASRLPQGVDAQHAITVVMCALSERLNLGEARHVVDSLPPGVDRWLEPCFKGRGQYAERFDRAGFYARVASRLRRDDVEPIVRGVLRGVQRYLPYDVLRHVHAQLPLDMQELWDNP